MTLYKNLLASKSERVNMLYNEWDKTFRYVYGGVLDDLSFDEILKDIVKAITPVPGGVGPMTITMLMKNTIDAFYKRNGG